MPPESPPHETPPLMLDLKGFHAEVVPITPNRPRRAPNGWRVLDATIAGKLTIFPKADYLSLFHRARHRGTVSSGGLWATFRGQEE
jgi:hypothetical protein